jgi:hypothetical protein
VPFYFCPRSLMLFVIYRQNHPDLAYRDGQEPIVHQEADLHEVVNRACWMWSAMGLHTLKRWRLLHGDQFPGRRDQLNKWADQARGAEGSLLCPSPQARGVDPTRHPI